MPEVEIKDRNNKIVGQITLSDEVFGVQAKDGVIHGAIVNFLANQRQGTHATKTKGLVRGGGKKPWKHARWPAGLPMLSWWQEFVPVDKLAK